MIPRLSRSCASGLCARPHGSPCALALGLLAAAFGLHAQEPPPIGFSYGPELSMEHDSNLYRTSVAPGNSPVVSDVLTTAALVGTFHDTYSRQTVDLNANVGRVLYRSQRSLDFTEENIHASIASDLPLNSRAMLTAMHVAQMAHFAELGSASRDVITTNTLAANSDFPFASEWRAVLDASGSKSRNGSVLFQSQDFYLVDLDAGIRFQPVSDNHIDLVMRTVHGYYPNGAPSNLLGPDYRDRGGDLRVDWTLSGQSRIQGRAGFVRRRDDDQTYRVLEFSNFQVETFHLNRDFAGPAYDLTYIWQPRAQIQVNLYGLRGTGAAGDNNYLSAVTHRLRLTPTYQASSKLAIDVYYDWSGIKYFSDIYSAYYNQPPGTARLDDSHSAGLEVQWSPRHWLQLSLDLHRENRDSSIPEWSYNNYVASISLQGTF